MSNKNPIEYKGKVLDQRNNITGPEDAGKGFFPKPPKHVAIQNTNTNKVK